MEKTALRIRILGDPALRKTARRFKNVTQADRETFSQMARLMYSASGIGLAAPQVGINKALIVVDIGSGLYKLANPGVVHKEGVQVLEEGCLSVPGVCVKVRRAQKVVVKALDEFGKPLSIEAQDLFACVLQHEIEHLKGKLIVDYASFLERFRIKKQMQLLQERYQSEKLPESETKSCKVQL